MSAIKKHKSTLTKIMEDLARELEVSVEGPAFTKNNHIEFTFFRPEDGRKCRVICASTPSDGRAIMNARTAAKHKVLATMEDV